MKVLADKWKNLSRERKEPYERQAAVDARRYKLEVIRAIIWLINDHFYCARRQGLFSAL